MFPTYKVFTAEGGNKTKVQKILLVSSEYRL